jgi:Zn-dependent peptidase ImmA (M78 family)
LPKSPERVLKECGINSRPIPLERILEFYRIELVQLRAGADIFGAILRQSDRVVIAVNPDQHLNRQRFTVAHELGHFFCHYSDRDKHVEHVDGDFRVSWRNAVSSQGVKWDEIEANRFAAALLMPETLLRQDLDRLASSSNKEVADVLASTYKVSRVAMQFRLINLGLLPPDVDPSGE